MSKQKGSVFQNFFYLLKRLRRYRYAATIMHIPEETTTIPAVMQSAICKVYIAAFPNNCQSVFNANFIVLYSAPPGIIGIKPGTR